MMIKKIYNFIKEKLFYFLIGGVALASTIAIIPDDLTSTELIQRDGIEEVLKDKTHKEKVEIKSKELSKVEIKDKFIKKGIEIEIIGDIIEIEGGIELFAKAWKDGKQLGFGKDGTVEIERFRIYNPPVLVDDENGEIIREWYDEITKKDEQRKLKYNPEEAIKESLAHTISQVAKDGKNIIKGKVGNTTSTFYSAAGANSPVDGYANRAANETWANLVANAGTGANVTGLAIMAYWANNGSNFTNQIRGIVTFNTAVIDTDTISSATLSLYGKAKLHNGNGDAPTYYMVSASPANTNNLVAADYNIANWGSTAFATGITQAAWSLAGYNDFSLNASGVTNISKTGVSKFGLRQDLDINDANNNSNSSEGYAQGYSADQAGTSNDPKLVVEHSAPVSRRIIMIE